MNKTLDFLKKNISTVIALAVTACIYIIFYLTEAECPIKYLFGISCPGCGMSRALICAIHLDLASAFYYHPHWFALLPVLVILIIFSIKKNKKAFYNTLTCAVILLTVTYLARLIFSDNSVVVFAPTESAIARLSFAVFN